MATAEATSPLCCDGNTPGPAQVKLKESLARVVEDGPSAIEQRLEDLSREWSSGQLAKATLGVVILAGVSLLIYVHPWFVALPILGALLLVQSFLSQPGWVGEIYRAMGFRRRDEIEQERLALRTLRGDFRHAPTLRDIEDSDAVSRMEGEGGGVVSGDGDSAKLNPKEAVSQIMQAVKA